MKVLVTGATGFVGQHLIPQLLQNGHKVTAVARDEINARRFDWYEKVQFIARDIYQPTENTYEFYGQPDALIHLAWGGLPNYKALFHFEETLPQAYRFIKSLVEDGISHLLVVGTCLEYGMQNGCLSETMESCPSNSYALAKDTLRKSIELMVADKNVHFQWARLFYMHGIGQNPSSLIAQLNKSLTNHDAVFNMSQGDQLRDYLPVTSVAEKLALLLEHPECSGLVNICSGQPITIRSLVESYIFEQQVKIELNLGYYPYPDYEPFAFWGNDNKFNFLTSESV